MASKMPRKRVQDPFLIVVLTEGRVRCAEWDHPVTAEESDILSLIHANLLSDDDKSELAMLYTALEDQRKTDNHEYHNNREPFIEKLEEDRRKRVAYVHNLFFKKLEET